jgi:hypothetical protein
LAAKRGMRIGFSYCVCYASRWRMIALNNAPIRRQ